jgi:predicted ribosomally synthesized peptide with nif11-like leader
MISEIDRFHKAIHDSVELRLALQSLSGLDDFVTFANVRGYNFTVPELHEWNKRKRKGELTESELELAAGGSDANIWQAIKSVMFGSDSSY